MKKNDVIYQFVYDLIGIFDDKYKIICNFKYDDNGIKFNCTLFLQQDFGKRNFLLGKNIIPNIVSYKEYNIKNKIEIYTYFYGENTNKITSIDVLSDKQLNTNKLEFEQLNNFFNNIVSSLKNNNSGVQKEINKENNDIIIIPDLNGNYMTLLRILQRLFYIGKINKGFILGDVKIIIIGKTFGEEEKANKIIFLTIYNLIINNSGKVFWVKDDNDESNNFVRNNQNIKEYYKKLPYVIMIKDNDISINKKNFNNKYQFMINTYCVSSYSYINKIIYGNDNENKNEKLFKFIKENQIKYFILSSENNYQINSLESSNSKYVNDLNLQQDIYDARFIFRFGNGKKINGASTIINDDAKFWWGEEAPYMKEILGKNKILDFITEKINGLNRSDIKKYKEGVIKNIFLNRYYPILFTTNLEYFDNFIVIRKNDIGKENNISNNGNVKNRELNSFFNQIFNGINVIKNKNIKQFIVNESIAVNVVNKGIAVNVVNKGVNVVNKAVNVVNKAIAVNINTNCPGSMVGIENKNIKNGNNGGKVYCYLNSLMQMLYCMEELRDNNFLEAVFSLLNGKGNSLVNINKNKNNNIINNQYIPAEIIVNIYQEMYPDQNILTQHSPSEFLLYTFDYINKNINFITKNIDDTININLTFYNVNNNYNFKTNFNEKYNEITDKKKYMFININKVISKNNTSPIVNFASLEINNIYKDRYNDKFNYKLIGAIFYINNNHYTFASYDNNGNVCRYYDDKFIYESLPDDITLEKNAMILLYKEYKDK